MLILELMIAFALLSLGASFVNGAIGYGYSSISTPLALLILVNKIVNPAYVLLEATANTVMVVISGKSNLRTAVRRVYPMLISLAPGAVLGSFILATLATSAPNWAKFIVYATILPLILLQSLGIRRAIKRETLAGIPLGFGIGLVYSITTISGPPIALFLNNQGLKREEFKASISLIRITESYITCATYYSLGLFNAKSVGWFGSVTPMELFGVIAIPVLVGLPLGVFAAKRLNLETFRRICMNFDAWIVGYGLTRVLVTFFNVNVNVANAIYAVIVGVALIILFRYFRMTRTVDNEKQEAIPVESRAPPSRSPGYASDTPSGNPSDVVAPS